MLGVLGMLPELPKPVENRYLSGVDSLQKTVVIGLASCCFNGTLPQGVFNDLQWLFSHFTNRVQAECQGEIVYWKSISRLSFSLFRGTHKLRIAAAEPTEWLKSTRAGGSGPRDFWISSSHGVTFHFSIVVNESIAVTIPRQKPCSISAAIDRILACSRYGT